MGSLPIGGAPYPLDNQVRFVRVKTTTKLSEAITDRDLRFGAARLKTTKHEFAVPFQHGFPRGSTFWRTP